MHEKTLKSSFVDKYALFYSCVPGTLTGIGSVQPAIAKKVLNNKMYVLRKCPILSIKLTIIKCVIFFIDLL